MALLPLLITARRGTWRQYTARNRNEKFESLKKAVLERDHYTCRYCDFFSKKFHTVVNIDHNYKNNHLNNLATACAFCTQCFFLDSVGLDSNSGGKLIFLPEISQPALNNFCRVLYCSMDKESAYKAKLQSIYMSLAERGKDVVACFGVECDNPKVFGRTLIDANLDPKYLKHQLLNHIRLLPSKRVFKQQIDYWKNTVFEKIPL